MFTQNMKLFLDQGITREIEGIVKIGIHHEKQHQEIINNGYVNIYLANPLLPVFSSFPQKNIIPDDYNQECKNCWGHPNSMDIIRWILLWTMN